MTRSFGPILLGLALLLTACGPAGTPTLSPADVEGTAVSAAWTVVAATQQAIPTATPIPPTATASPTPPPTFTPFAAPTLSTPSPPPAVQASGTDNCLHPLNMGEAGPKHRVRLENNSGGTINLSLNLWQINLFGQCGALSWSNKAPGWKEIVEVPAGSWYAYAWIQLKGGKSAEHGGSFSIGYAADDLIVVDVQADKILAHYP